MDTNKTSPPRTLTEFAHHIGQAIVEWNAEDGMWVWHGGDYHPLVVGDEMKWIIPVLPWSLAKIGDDRDAGYSVYCRVDDSD